MTDRPASAAEADKLRELADRAEAEATHWVGTVMHQGLIDAAVRMRTIAGPVVIVPRKPAP
jgi:hypothetical protein